MEDQHSTYTYTPIDERRREIRLVHLLPGHDVDIICCTFTTASLDDSPDFEALSYVWGDPEGVLEINLEGHSFSITKNLHCALMNLREVNRERIMWIDAICVNQGNNSERSSQVAQMKDIYGSASTVVAFLGNAWTEFRNELRILTLIESDHSAHFDPLLEPHIDVGGAPLEFEAFVGILHRLTSLPWFQRLWTVQEYVLARRLVLQCGRNTMSREWLHSLCENTNRHISGCCWRLFKDTTNGDAFADSIGVMETLSTLYEQKESPTALQALARVRSRGCHDTRDRVYGALGLANQAQLTPIRPDYDRRPADVYTDVFVASIGSTKTLDVLGYVYGSRWLDLALPTFVPDWTASVVHFDEPLLVDRCGIVEKGTYNACSDSLAELTTAEGRATSRAILADVVHETIVAHDVKHDKLFELYCACLECVMHTNTPYVSRTEALWRTLCGERIRNRDANGVFTYELNEASPRKFLQWFAWASASCSSRLLAGGVPMFEADGVLDFMMGFSTVKAQRDFFITERGYMGFGPRGCTRGDVVAVLPGGKVPYVLRADAAHFVFLGDAYVQGIMQGEAYDEGKLEQIVLV